MKDKLIQILFKGLWGAFKSGQGVSPFDADNSEFWQPNFELSVAPPMADEILALPLYEKEFVEWIGENCTRVEFTKEWIYHESPMVDKFYNSTDEIYQFWQEKIQTKPKTE